MLLTTGYTEGLGEENSAFDILLKPYTANRSPPRHPTDFSIRGKAGLRAFPNVRLDLCGATEHMRFCGWLSAVLLRSRDVSLDMDPGPSSEPSSLISRSRWVITPCKRRTRQMRAGGRLAVTLKDHHVPRLQQPFRSPKTALLRQPAATRSPLRAFGDQRRDDGRHGQRAEAPRRQPETETPFTAPPAFEAMGLSRTLLRAVTAEGYDTPTPIQREAIPVLLEGRDLLGIAQTGTARRRLSPCRSSIS